MKLVGGFTFTSSLACKFTLKKTCLHFQQSNFSHHCYHRCALMRKNLQASSHQNHHCFLQNTIKSFSYFYIQQPLPNHFLHNRVVIFLITTKLQLFSHTKIYVAQWSTYYSSRLEVLLLIRSIILGKTWSQRTPQEIMTILIVYLQNSSQIGLKIVITYPSQFNWIIVHSLSRSNCLFCRWATTHLTENYKFPHIGIQTGATTAENTMSKSPFDLSLISLNSDRCKSSIFIKRSTNLSTFV